MYRGLGGKRVWGLEGCARVGFRGFLGMKDGIGDGLGC